MPFVYGPDQDAVLTIWSYNSNTRVIEVVHQGPGWDGRIIFRCDNGAASSEEVLMPMLYAPEPSFGLFAALLGLSALARHRGRRRRRRASSRRRSQGPLARAGAAMRW